MGRFPRVLLASLAMLALCAPLAFADDDDDDGPPRIEAKAANPVSEVTATLRAKIDPADDDDWPTWYRFQYGTTTAYGFTTATQVFWDDDSKTVSVQVGGLIPGTLYNFRAVASNYAGTTNGPNTQFTTKGKAPGAVGDAKVSEPAGPTLGQTVVAEVSAGTVLVKEKGSSEFHALDSAETIPIKSVLDTSQGTVILETALAGGESQTGTFHGGAFQVRQSRSGKGMTEIALRGGSFASCTQRPASRRTVTYRKKNTIRKLWGEDNGGRFKTSGKGSVATVRGTSWYTADRCDGTLTKVESGAVMVRERGTGRSKLLRPGQSFLARIPH